EGWLEDIDEALATLPQGERDAVELRVVHELTYDEVARGLSTTPGAARVRVARGLGRLRERLIRDEREAV
ncbi:MAG: sigma factor-like helix-turn-helix DNA-binding protein, partial [Gaiellaceae bacterium]